VEPQPKWMWGWKCPALGRYAASYDAECTKWSSRYMHRAGGVDNEVEAPNSTSATKKSQYNRYQTKWFPIRPAQPTKGSHYLIRFPRGSLPLLLPPPTQPQATKATSQLRPASSSQSSQLERILRWSSCFDFECDPRLAKVWSDVRMASEVARIIEDRVLRLYGYDTVMDQWWEEGDVRSPSPTSSPCPLTRLFTRTEQGSDYGISILQPRWTISFAPPPVSPALLFSQRPDLPGAPCLPGPLCPLGPLSPPDRPECSPGFCGHGEIEEGKKRSRRWDRITKCTRRA
jgi:hypothetical protein